MLQQSCYEELSETIDLLHPTPEQHEKLRRLSFERKMSMSQLIRYALDKVYFDGGEQKQ